MPNSLQIKLTGYATETKQDIIDTVVDAIKAKTDNLPTDPADQSLLKAEIDANETKIDTVDGVVDAIKAKTDALPASPAPAGEYDTEMARITANVATEAKQDIIDTVVDAIKTKTDALPTDPADESLLEAHVTAEVDDLITRTKGLNDIHDDLAAKAVGAQFTDYHYYTNLAVGATYTPPAKALAMLVVDYGSYGSDAVNVELYDGASWLNTAEPEAEYDGAPIHYMQDNAQSTRIINDYGGARKITFVGVTWS